MSKLFSKNPRSGELIAETDVTPVDGLPLVFDRSRSAQSWWAAVSPKQRAAVLLQVRELILNQSEAIVELIAKENGKPAFEALANEVLPAVNLITFFAKRTPKLLRDRPIKLVHFKHRSSHINYWPLGIVSIITPWNHPFFLPLGEIVVALLAGNSVIFKPSEFASQIGLKIQDLFDEAGLPPNVLQTLVGDDSLGAAIVEQKPAKIFFTGRNSVGKKIASIAADNLIPLNLELNSKDSMIVLRDAPMDFATSAALWGSFSNSGQLCGSVSKIIVHESIVDSFTEQLRIKLSKIESDFGFFTVEEQRAPFLSLLEEAKNHGCTLITKDGSTSTDSLLRGTIVAGANIEETRLYNEDFFGPAVAIATFKSLNEAVKKANATPYGLHASIITKNFSLGEQIAKQLEVGTVTINEVAYTGALPETPWGGVKQSGFGKKHSSDGIYEFVNIRHIHKPRSRLFVFKSPWWFPYTAFQYSTFKRFIDLYHRHWTDKIKAFPLFLWNLVQFFKREKRL